VLFRSRGEVVHPDGHVGSTPCRLPADQWEPVFDQHDPALNVHIPAGPGLAPQACRESIERAITFFPQHFPDRAFKLIWCYSWLLDAQFKAYLPETSNIIGFQNQFYLLPFPNTSGWQTYERVFGNEKPDLAHVEAKTSLQRAVVEHVRRGGAWRCPAGVIFPESYATGDLPYREADWWQAIQSDITTSNV